MAGKYDTYDSPCLDYVDDDHWAVPECYGEIDLDSFMYSTDWFKYRSVYGMIRDYYYDRNRYEGPLGPIIL